MSPHDLPIFPCSLWSSALCTSQVSAGGGEGGSHTRATRATQQETSVLCPGGPEGRVPDSLLWDRVRERDRLPSKDAALVREAVRERDRRVIQEEATVEREG